jgi:hypothetical protein
MMEKDNGTVESQDVRRQEITAHVCGGPAVKRCVDGGEHDMSKIVRFADGGSVACAKCGVTAMEIDMWELP